MKIKLFVLSFLLCSLSVHAQRKIEHASVDDVLEQTEIKKQSKFHTDLDYSFFWGINRRAYGQTFTRKTDGNMPGHHFHLSFRYDVHPLFSVGLGTGLDFDNEGNTIPLLGIVRYKIQKVKNLYAFTHLGFSPRFAKPMTGGAIFDLGVGYTKMFAKHFGINFQLGYNFRTFNNIKVTSYRYEQLGPNPSDYTVHVEDLPIKGTLKRNAFFATVGLTF